MQRMVEDCLLEWESRRQLGEDATPADLCPDSVAQQAEIAHCIALLKACDRLLDVSPCLEDLPARPLPRFIGRYEVRGELGQGGMGVVWKVWDPALRREAALKMLRPTSPWHDEGDVRRLSLRFQREAQVLAQLEHDHIVPVFEAGLHEGQPYFVMEYVGGGCLSQHMVALRGQGPKAAAAFMAKVARAVDHAHQKGVLHRDLKPANILMDGAGEPFVSDFGLAKLLAHPVDHEAETEDGPYVTSLEPSGVAEASHLTAPGWQPGTAAYMAPEQFDAAFGEVGPATDVWALGVVLRECLTGQKPFGSGTREVLRDSICNHPPKALSHGPDRRLEKVVLRCLEKAPERRYPSAGALADALDRCHRRRWQKWVSVAACFMAVVVLGSWWIIRERDPEKRYERRVAPILAKLEKGEAVDLVSEGEDLPPYRIRCGEGIVKVCKTSEGISITSPTLSTVEFLPGVPWPSYRIEAEVRHDHSAFLLRGLTSVGVIFSNRTLAKANGVHHVTGHLKFNDGSEPAPVPKGRPLPDRKVCLQLLWHLEARENDPVAFVSYPWIASEGAVFHKDEGRGHWRTIRIEVTPEEITAQAGQVPGKTLGPFTTAYEYIQFPKTLQQDQPEVQGIDLSPIDQRIIGVLVAGGQCTVRRLRVIPQSKPIP